MNADTLAVPSRGVSRGRRGDLVAHANGRSEIASSPALLAMTKDRRSSAFIGGKGCLCLAQSEIDQRLRSELVLLHLRASGHADIVESIDDFHIARHPEVRHARLAPLDQVFG